MEGVVSRFSKFGKEFVFFVDNTADYIQGHHLNGELYENEELRIIQEHAAGARVVVDIGANVGNHAIFMAKVLGAQKVYAFEPNRSAAEVLKLNVLLNNAGNTIDTSYVGLGLGERLGLFRVESPMANNIGAARLVEEKAAGTGGNPAEEMRQMPPPAPGPEKAAATNKGLREEGTAAGVMVCPFDSLSLAEEPQFVKIDVMGMEIPVLRGMSKTIKRFRPSMFIDVSDHNLGLFSQWINANDYVTVARFKRYGNSENFLIKHRSAV
jgi:FkbM family methyltransferase